MLCVLCFRGELTSLLLWSHPFSIRQGSMGPLQTLEFPAQMTQAHSVACLPLCSVSPTPNPGGGLSHCCVHSQAQGLAKEQLFARMGGCERKLDMGLGGFHVYTWGGGGSFCVAMFQYQTCWSLRSRSLNLAFQIVIQVYLSREKDRRREQTVPVDGHLGPTFWGKEYTDFSKEKCS